MSPNNSTRSFAVDLSCPAGAVLRRCRSAARQPQPPRARAEWRCERAETVHGFALWWNASRAASCQRRSPHAPRTHWEQLTFRCSSRSARVRRRLLVKRAPHEPAGRHGRALARAPRTAGGRATGARYPQGLSRLRRARPRIAELPVSRCIAACLAHRLHQREPHARALEVVIGARDLEVAVAPKVVGENARRARR